MILHFIKYTYHENKRINSVLLQDLLEEVS